MKIEKKTRNLKKHCHSGNVYCFNIGSNEIYGGGLYRDADYNTPDIIVALGIDIEKYRKNIVEFQGFPENELLQLHKIFSKYTKNKIAQKRIIYLDWEDGDIIDLDRDFWIALIEWIKQLQNKKILFSCLGGHGRTGTALAILAGLHFKVEHPITFIRQIYCKNAVETHSQVDYVNMICNTKDFAKPSWDIDNLKWYLPMEKWYKL